MSKAQTLLTLLFREFQEYRTSLCWTPLLLVVGLSTVLFIAVLMAEHISAVGEAVSQVFPSQGQGDSSVSVHVDRDADGKPVIEYRVQQSGAVPGDPAPAPPAIPAAQVDTAGSLNSLFNGLHQLFVMVFLLVCANYLLAALYTDRRDRSILFWKSMPVSDGQEVLAKYAVAMLAAPLLFIAASMLAQLVCMLLGMLLLWRMEIDPFVGLIDKLDFFGLFAGQLGNWLLMTLWLAPTYAWILLASAAARRSPFMWALAPVLILLFLEKILFGTARLATLLSRHIPHLGSAGDAGFYWQGSADLLPLLGGLLFAACALWAATFLRRYYFEL